MDQERQREDVGRRILFSQNYMRR